MRRQPRLCSSNSRFNPTRMSPDVQARFQEMVNTLGQQVISLPSLQEIIESHDLYREMRERQPMFDVAAAMRNYITITPQRGADVLRVSFVGDDPVQVARTANALAARFVEENIRYREQRVTETSAYIRDELTITKEALDKQEESMRDYKLRYYNEMPDQRAANIARLNTLQTQYQNIQNNLQDLKRTQLLIQEQINLRQDHLARLAEGQVGGIAEVDRVRMELEALRRRYTENHPDVRRLQSRLTALLAEHAVEDEAESSAGPTVDPTATLPHDNQLAQLKLQLRETEISEARLSRDLDAVRQRIDQVQRWVDATPVREAEWAALTRDYGQLQQHYQALVSRNLEADSAEMLERRQRGSQFRIIESAHLPSKPSSPDMIKIMAVAFILGLGMGLGLSYAREFFDTSFKDVNELEAALGLPVTCAIPLIPTTSEKRGVQLAQGNAWLIALG
jgi:polysaccharide chain length determinant protein (PEP-CTERM system associated)